MNKNELNRLVAWRLKLLRQAEEMPRGVAQTCRHYCEMVAREGI